MLLTGSVTLALLAAAQTVSAQPLAPKLGGTAIEIVTGVMDFDFQGTGQTMPFNVRVTRAVTDRVSLEFGATVARPVESFGGRSTFATPEARAVYAWRLGRFSPFVAGGGGFSVMRRPLFRDKWQATLTAGGGARFDLSERVYAVGEMRLRGVTTSFAASTAEWIGGLGFRL